MATMITSFRTDENTDGLLKEYAGLTGLTCSEIVRKAVTYYVVHNIYYEELKKVFENED